MALTKCPDCGKEVSSVAPTCPSCGHPIAAHTTELTSKKWKSMKLAAIALVILGIIFMFTDTEGSNMAVVSTFMILGGITIGIYAKAMTWWHHK